MAEDPSSQYHVVSLVLAYWPFVVVVSVALFLSKTYFHCGLHRYPGPFLANFTDAWRVWDTSRNDHQQTMIRLHERHGSVVRTGPNTVDISDVEYVPKIYGIKAGFLKTAFYDSFVTIHKGKFNRSLFSLHDEAEHANQKRPVANMYALSTLQGYEPLVDEMIGQFVARLTEEFSSGAAGGGGRACDMSAWLQYYAFDVVLNLTFGNTLGFMAQGVDAGGFIRALELALDRIALHAQMPWTAYVGKHNPIARYLLKRDGNVFPAFVRQQIAEHRAKLEAEKSDPAERSGPSEKGAPSAPPSPRHAEDMLTGFMRIPSITTHRVTMYAMQNVMAGSDTTAITLRAILYFLLRHPPALQKLRAELYAAELSRPVTWKQSQRLPYLRAVVEESLRCFPAVGLQLERKVPAAGLEMPDGHVLPAGTHVGVNPWVVHHQREAFGPLPTESWIPERWLRAEAETAAGGGDGGAVYAESEAQYQERLARMKRADLAFGWGKRICIGRNISYLEIYKVVPTLLLEFDIELAHPEREWETINRWFVRQKGMDCFLKRRVTSA